ncbi:hypothetical protein T4B_7821 [Trichinella pseudospiralis]|uniref:Uncharacterized protein n=1 Tax=Trichinella pseudospiralis TaxID=6337 RepID=A0A0V1GZJ7_TRIPS|nr:hypothetical protein T4B_7821 [Trichinella pseudospiralis]
MRLGEHLTGLASPELEFLLETLPLVSVGSTSLRPHVTPKRSGCRYAVRSLRSGSSSQISGSRR